VGVFDELISRWGAEDYDLFFRISRHYEIAYIDEPLALYRNHGISLTGNSLAMLESELYVVRKALKTDPELARLCGEKTVSERLYSLLFGIGYGYHDIHKNIKVCRYI
jgi:hypothetical protein